MEDPTVRRLTKKVFPYLWLRHKLISSVPSTGIFRFSEMTVFSQGIGNAVIVYLHMFRPTLSKYLEKHIPSMPKARLQFWTHVAFLCLQVRLTHDKVFDYFLTTCAITAEVALHCYMNGYDDVLSLASEFFCAFFENELYEGFHKSGGWDGLHQYIKDTLCKEWYEVVDNLIENLRSPSEPGVFVSPVFITIQNEQLAAERRKKLVSLLSLKISEIERKDQTNTLVTGISYWYFMENHRISENKSSILKRTENVRHKKNQSNITMDERRHNESLKTDEELYAYFKISKVVDPLCLQDEDQPLESVPTIYEKEFGNKAAQALDDSKCMKVREESINQVCTSNDTSERINYSSSLSLRELCNFYESLSGSSERKIDDSKNFRCNNETRHGQNLPAIKELINRYEKINDVESHTGSVPYSNKNSWTFPRAKIFSSQTKSVKQFQVDNALSEFTKSFQESGFRCLAVGNLSNFDEKSENSAIYAEVMEKCRFFQTKYSSTQFVILIPDNSSTCGPSLAPETNKCDGIIPEQQLSSITKEGFNNAVSPQKYNSETEKPRYEAAKDDKNQSRFANGLPSLQNCTTENIHKVKENYLSSIGKTSQQLFLTPPINEDQMLLRKKANLLGDKNATEPTTVSRFRDTQVNENQPRDGTEVLDKNWKSETTKIGRFTLTKVNENQPKDGIEMFVINWTNKVTETKTTSTKVNENESMDETSTLRKNCTNETTKTSKFTSEEVHDNQLKSRPGKSILKLGGNTATTGDENEAGDRENETVHLQDNNTVRYQKFVRFDEHPPNIKYYQTYPSGKSCDSITSRESPNKNSPEHARSSRNSGYTVNQENKSNWPSPENITVTQKRRFYQRCSSGVSQSGSSDKAESSNRSSVSDVSQLSSNKAEISNRSPVSDFFSKLFRQHASSNSQVDESRKENKEEMEQQNTEEPRNDIEDDGAENLVFKI